MRVLASHIVPTHAIEGLASVPLGNGKCPISPMVCSIHQYITEGKECLITAGWGRSLGFSCGLHKHHEVSGFITSRWGKMSWLTTWYFLKLPRQGCWSTSSQLNKVGSLDSPLCFCWCGYSWDQMCFFVCLIALLCLCRIEGYYLKVSVVICCPFCGPLARTRLPLELWSLCL